MASKMTHILRPVILAVPEKVREWAPGDRVKFLSRHAREALRMSAARSGVDLGAPGKNEDGVPLPSGGYYWSISHKTRFVAGVVSPGPVGIDLEEIRPVHKGLHARVAGDEEWRLASEEPGSERMFFRFWTAKEAVMKAEGTGIRDLSTIKIRRVIDDTRLSAVFRGNRWEITQLFFSNHVAALTDNGVGVNWEIEPSA